MKEIKKVSGDKEKVEIELEKMIEKLQKNFRRLRKSLIIGSTQKITWRTCLHLVI